MRTEQVGDVHVVRPEFDIVASQLDTLRRQLQELVTQGRVNLAIDLSDVSMIDSKGLALFVLCHKSVTAKGGRLVVLSDRKDFRELFRIMRLDQHIVVAESLERARAGQPTEA